MLSGCFCLVAEHLCGWDQKTANLTTFTLGLHRKTDSVCHISLRIIDWLVHIPYRTQSSESKHRDTHTQVPFILRNYISVHKAFKVLSDTRVTHEYQIGDAGLEKNVCKFHMGVC